MAARKGCQVPTQSAVLPYVKTYGNAAVKLYKETGRKAIRWQTDLLKNIMGVGKDGLWVHQKFGYSIPRRNGKNEIAAIRELWDLKASADRKQRDCFQNYFLQEGGRCRGCNRDFNRRAVSAGFAAEILTGGRSVPQPLQRF